MNMMVPSPASLKKRARTKASLLKNELWKGVARRFGAKLA